MSLKTKIDKAYILNKAQELFKLADIEKTPVNLKLLASLAGIKDVIEDDIEEAGNLIPNKGSGATIVLRESDSAEKKRFTIGHEITHTFLPGFELKEQFRDKNIGKFSLKNEVEYLCDYGASELLMPSFLFEPLFKKYGYSIDGLLVLAKAFESSLEATAIKMVMQNQEKYALIQWIHDYKPADEGKLVQNVLPGFEQLCPKPEKVLRVSFPFGFKKDSFVPKHKSLKGDCQLLKESFDKKERFIGNVEMDFEGFTIRTKIHAHPYSYGGKERMLTLLEDYKIN